MGTTTIRCGRVELKSQLLGWAQYAAEALIKNQQYPMIKRLIIFAIIRVGTTLSA